MPEDQPTISSSNESCNSEPFALNDDASKKGLSEERKAQMRAY
jgi:hypothetical protein